MREMNSKLPHVLIHVQPKMLPQANGENEVSQQTMNDGREKHALGFFVKPGKVQTGKKSKYQRNKAVVDNVNETESQAACQD